MKILYLIICIFPLGLGVHPSLASAPAPIVNTPISTPPPSPLILSKDEIKELIISYSKAYKIDPKLPLAIARCESGYKWDAKNKTSTASGVYQYLKGTWKNTPEGKAGVSVFNPHANINAAVRHLKHRGPSPWFSSKQCWENK